MAAINASAVRQLFASTVTALSGLEESKVILGDDSDPASLADGRFSVVLGAQDNLNQFRDNAAQGMRVRESVVVRFVSRIRPNANGDQLTDYDTALDRGHAIVVALMAGSGAFQQDMQIKYVGTIERRKINDGKYLLTDLAFEADHQESLT